MISLLLGDIFSMIYDGWGDIFHDLRCFSGDFLNDMWCFRGDPDSDLDLATSYPNSKFIAILPSDLIQAVQVEQQHLLTWMKGGLVGGVSVENQKRRFNPNANDSFYLQDELNSKSRELFNDCQKAVKDFLGGPQDNQTNCHSINLSTNIHPPINESTDQSRAINKSFNQWINQSGGAAFKEFRMSMYFHRYLQVANAHPSNFYHPSPCSSLILS